MAMEIQGIAVAILGSSDGGERGHRASLRRTLSADMSSKKWMAQNCLIKKTASSRDFFLNPIADSFDDDDEQEQTKSVEAHQKPSREFDIWTSIVAQGKNGDGAGEPAPPPYVHPLVKRKASSLSEKSLQICTESLGSETGSDGFSSTDSDAESEAEARFERKPLVSASAVTPARSFPPPLPSLSCRGVGDGAPALRMRSRRDNGRLVVEAVAVPTSPPNFSAQRCDGRLVLKLARTEIVKDDEIFEDETGESEVQFEDNDKSETEEEEEEEDEEEEVTMRNEKVDGRVTESRLINFHRLALMANKPIGLPNRNSNYINEDDNEDKKPMAITAMAQSLPPRPKIPSARLIPAPATAKVSTAAAASFNQYDYFWRSKINDDVKNDKKEIVVSRVDGYYLVPLLKKCCKEPKRTVIWHPRCIATS